MTPGRASVESHLLCGGGKGLPEAERKRLDITKFLQQVESDFPLVVGEVLPDVVHRDVVLGGDVFGHQQ
ncbi:hypothetical protein ACIQMR_27495 [Streptomyces sp. NPDC091376]|uniref:hypothetical protein n=1 Tax=Streptomyces sp. NPDC091376 TaxID=3365994 RepID=UPI00381EA105